MKNENEVLKNVSRRGIELTRKGKNEVVRYINEDLELPDKVKRLSKETSDKLHNKADQVTCDIKDSCKWIEKLRRINTRSVAVMSFLLCLFFMFPAFSFPWIFVNYNGDYVNSKNNVDITPFSIVGGLSCKNFMDMDIQFTEPARQFIFLLIIPLVMFIIWLVFSDSIKGKIFVYITMIAGIIADIKLLTVFKEFVYEIEKEWPVEIEEQFGYTYSFIILGILAILLVVNAIFTYIPMVKKNNVTSVKEATN